MAADQNPTPDTPSHLFGLPRRRISGGKRDPVEIHAPLDVCMKAWLDLPAQHRQNCTLSIGEPGKGLHLADKAIGRFAVRMGYVGPSAAPEPEFQQMPPGSAHSTPPRGG